MARPVTHSLVKALQRVPGFDLLPDKDLLRIVGASVNLFWPAGSLVFEKDSPGEALFIVLSGRVRILDEVDGHETEIAETGPGDFFGEMSLMLETTHSKSVRVTEDAELLVLRKESFRALMAEKPDLAATITRRLEERQAETMARIAQTDRAAASHP